MEKLISLLAFLCLFSSLATSGQDSVPPGWNSERIRGTRHLPYLLAAGHPYLYDNLISGDLELMNGYRFEDLKLSYSCYRDELIYYNPEISARIVIDKSSVKGFGLTDKKGGKRIFRQLFYGGYPPGKRFFEILSDGKIKLLAYRKVTLDVCAPYNDISGKLNNVNYQEAHSYYLYHPEKGYELLRINVKSLLAKFSPSDQKLIKGILRKNGIRIKREESFVQAWKVISESGLEPICLFEKSAK